MTDEPLFRLTGDEVLFLPIYAQVANLHLSLLRDGVLKGWEKPTQFQARLAYYKQYVLQTFLKGYADRLKQSSDFNYVNAYVRQMRLSVLNFAPLWKYYDPSAYPNPVQVILPDEIYETVSEAMKGSNALGYTLRAQTSGYISQIVTSDLIDFYDNYRLLQGATVNYSCGGLSTCVAAAIPALFRKMGFLKLVCRPMVTSCLRAIKILSQGRSYGILD